MAELIGCRECDSPSCKGCNIKILADMLNRGKLNALMNKNRCIDGSVDASPVVYGHWIEHYSFGCFHYDCSICDDGFAIKNKQKELPNYCSNCGAKMGGRKEDD